MKITSSAPLVRKSSIKWQFFCLFMVIMTMVLYAIFHEFILAYSAVYFTIMFAMHAIAHRLSLYKMPGAEYLELQSEQLLMKNRSIPISTIRRCGVSLGRFYVIVKGRVLDHTLTQSVTGYDPDQLKNFLRELRERLK